MSLSATATASRKCSIHDPVNHSDTEHRRKLVDDVNYLCCVSFGNSRIRADNEAMRADNELLKAQIAQINELLMGEYQLVASQ